MKSTTTPRRLQRRTLALTAGLSTAALVVVAGCSGTDGAAVSSGSSIAVLSASSSDSSMLAGPPLTTTGDPSASLSSESSSASASESVSPSASTETSTSSAAPATTAAAPATTSATASSTTTTTAAPPAPTTSEPEDGDVGGAEVPAPEFDPNAPFTGNPGNLPLTAPGAVLTYTDTATIPFSNGEADGVFTISAMSVTPGRQSDWATLGIDADTADGAEPWFLRMTVTQVGGSKFSYPSVEDDLWAYTTDDLVNTMYPDDDTNPLCPLSTVPDSFTVGDSYQACVILTVIPGTSVDRVQFEGGWSDDDPYLNSPVVWKP